MSVTNKWFGNTTFFLLLRGMFVRFATMVLWCSTTVCQTWPRGGDSSCLRVAVWFMTIDVKPFNQRCGSLWWFVALFFLVNFNLSDCLSQSSVIIFLLRFDMIDEIVFWFQNVGHFTRAEILQCFGRWMESEIEKNITCLQQKMMFTTQKKPSNANSLWHDDNKRKFVGCGMPDAKTMALVDESRCGCHIHTVWLKVEKNWSKRSCLHLVLLELQVV